MPSLSKKDKIIGQNNELNMEDSMMSGTSGKAIYFDYNKALRNLIDQDSSEDLTGILEYCNF